MVKHKVAFAVLAIALLAGIGLIASNGAWAAAPEAGVITRESSLMIVSSVVTAMAVGLIVAITGIRMILRRFRSDV